MENLAIATKADIALKSATELIISNDDAMHFAGEMLKSIKALAAEVKRDREDERLAAKATLDAILAGRNRHLTPLTQAEQIIKQKQIVYEDEKARQRREEQARLEAEAQAEAERLAEEAALLAAELEAVGETEQAQAVLESPIEAPAPVILPPTATKIEGQHTVVTWKCRLVNKSIVPRELLAFDQVAANRLVQDVKFRLTKRNEGERSTVDKTVLAEIADLPNGSALPQVYQEIPGVEIFIEKTRASRGR